MNYKPIIIVHGEPNSIFLEIFFKSLKSKKIMSPLILISSLKLVKLQMKRLNYNKKIKSINYKNLHNFKFDNKTINLINVDYKTNTPFKKISKDSTLFINNCFKIAIKIINSGFANKLINGPISKKHFLKKKFPGITEYLASNFKIRNVGMLIYNSKLSVLPLTTHLPLKMVAKSLSKELVYSKIELINDFYLKFLGFKPKIAILGLNPHCESINVKNEDDIIIKPAVNFLKKKGFQIFGPYPADTIFLKSNRKKFNVIVGIYHDQVLTPIKTIYEYDAINITLGLPILRISPDHGPNEKMMGKNLSSPLSLIKAIQFLEKH